MPFALRPFNDCIVPDAGGRSEKAGTKGNMKNMSKLIVALVLGWAAWMATAQPENNPPPEGGPPGGPWMRHHRPPPPFMQVLDANTNHIIDADEIANATAALKTLDKNGDGQLTLDELLGPPPPGFGGGTNHPPVPPIIAAIDTNHDGVIDADELANAPAALRTLDKNGDGQLTPDEFAPRWRRGPHGQGGWGGPGGPPPGDAPPPQDSAPQQ
jgi:EF hand